MLWGAEGEDGEQLALRRTSLDPALGGRDR